MDQSRPCLCTLSILVCPVHDMLHDTPGNHSCNGRDCVMNDVDVGVSESACGVD